MRQKRIKDEGESYYHIVSRCCRLAFLFDDKAKDYIVKMMRRVEGFSGVEVLAYCVLDNHFHMLVHVPERRDVDEEELLRRITTLESSAYAAETAARWEMLRNDGNAAEVEKEQERLRRRFCNISCFASNLKQRVSVWHHQRIGTAGTIWTGLYDCTVVEGSSQTLSIVAAYIDLNPVRAGIVKDPKNYRWSSYGAAMAGDTAAQRGLARIYAADANGADFKKKFEAEYRGNLYIDKKDKLSVSNVKQIINDRGKLSLPELLRCKVRYFTKSTFFGSKDFVNAEFEKHRYAFGPKRKTGARDIRICKDWDGERLFSARELQKDVVTIPDTKPPEPLPRQPPRH